MRGLIPRALVFTVLVSPPMAYGLSGNDWNKLTEPMQTIYVGGVVDAWANYGALQKDDASKPSTTGRLFQRADDCVSPQMTYRQLRAMVAKWMSDHPEEWHISMA